MKLTIDISDALLSLARQQATNEGVTLSTLVERGLSRVIDEADKPVSFKLRRAAYKGNGLQTEFRNASWDAISNAANEGRGG